MEWGSVMIIGLLIALVFCLIAGVIKLYHIHRLLMEQAKIRRRENEKIQEMLEDLLAVAPPREKVLDPLGL
jgi:cell division protein FtsL